MIGIIATMKLRKEPMKNLKKLLQDYKAQLLRMNPVLFTMIGIRVRMTLLMLF